jgi:hypothetical protein
VLKLLNRNKVDSNWSLLANLPFGSLRINCDSAAAFDVFTNSFRHYLHDRSPSTESYTLSITAIDEAQWLLLNEHLTMTHSSNEVKIFTWPGGKGVIINASFAIFAPDAPATDSFILVSSRPFMSSLKEPTKYTFHSDNPDYCADWQGVSDLIKGLYAFKTDTYCLHSALLERDGKGVLLVGDSGAGKTTASLALARGGFTFLTDDLLFLNTKTENRFCASGLLMSPNFVGQPPTSLQELESTLLQGQLDKSSATLDNFQVKSEINKPVKPCLILLLEKPGQRIDEHHLSEVEGQAALSALMNQIVDPFAVLRRIEHLNLADELTEQCTVKQLVTGRSLHSLTALIDVELEQIQCH